jgi:excisionase family DNA binding protein
MVNQSQLMTRSEAAEALAISLRKIDQLVVSGDLATVRIGRSIRFRASALEYFIEAHESSSKRRTVKRNAGGAK